MASDPLSLWQVLKEEYESFHGPLPSTCLYIKNTGALVASLKDEANPLSQHLLDQLAQESRDALLAHQSPAPLPENLQNELTDIINSRLTDQNLHRYYRASAEIDFTEILRQARVNKTPAELSNKPLADAELIRVNRLLLETAYPDMVADIEGDLKGIYTLIRREKHSALCLSGGGIRSGTFNLGILQGLARHGLLEKFDYLSTVSGGGFPGGWLSAWIHRKGLKHVIAQLSDPPESPVVPEPQPLAHLRSYSNFLSPRMGLLSADTWTMIATLLRNIILNWMVLIPFLIALLIIPRVWLSFLHPRSFNGLALAFKSSFGFPLSLAVGFIAQVIALTYIGLNLPSSGRSQADPDEHPKKTTLTNWLRRAIIGVDGQGRFLRFGLLPVLISAMAFTTYWARNKERERVTWQEVVAFALALVIIPAIISFAYRWWQTKDKLGALLHILGAAALIGVAQFMAGFLAWLGATNIPFFRNPESHIILYTCLALPLLLGLLMLAGTLISGLTSRYTEDDDQEWWSRSGAWIYIAGLAWVIFCGLVLYGPYLFVWLADWRTNSQYWTARVGAVAGIISGAISLFGGFSSKTPVNENEAKKAGMGAVVLQVATRLLGPLFLAFIFALLSFVAGWLLTLSTGLPGSLKSLLNVPAEMPTHSLDHLGILLHSPLRLLALLFVLLLVLGMLMGRAISTNKFSLHYFWRNRIIRAYLGASNHLRKPNPFTGFDSEDNLSMHELRPYQPGSPILKKDKPEHKETKLFHVLNMALNLTGSKKLAWQERKAESFTISPLHAGNYTLGYRKAMDYGRQPYNNKQGISLGTAIAISGAFASPNMGYMMSSPVVRFLMTLFNVRFGWWLGNPGRAGDSGAPFGQTYVRDSPRLSVTPIFQEALGLTDDQAGYVYLSDGGHFENFGLYEMVLRRCRMIVIGDGSSDESYSFQSLGLAVRQIRIDLGVPIVFDRFHITGRALDGKGAYCAIGKIQYSCVDGGSSDFDGDLILIKPSLLGQEPRDVLNYATEHGTFPQEFIGDQWFSESQFESYRALGSHIVDALCKREGSSEFTDLQAFQKNLETKLKEITLTDFEQNLLDNLKALPKSIGEILGHSKATQPTNGSQ